MSVCVCDSHTATRQLGIQFTLAQLLEEGVMHADPHPGNLLKSSSVPPRLVYLDFGLVAKVRD